MFKPVHSLLLIFRCSSTRHRLLQRDWAIRLALNLACVLVLGLLSAPQFIPARLSLATNLLATSSHFLVPLRPHAISLLADTPLL